MLETKPKSAMTSGAIVPNIALCYVWPQIWPKGLSAHVEVCWLFCALHETWSNILEQGRFTDKAKCHRSISCRSVRQDLAIRQTTMSQIVFPWDLSCPHGARMLQWSRWTDFFFGLALARRTIQARGGQVWQPPLSHCPSLFTRSCQLIKAYKWHISSAVFASTLQTPAKLAGLAAFPLKCRLPF